MNTVDDPQNPMTWSKCFAVPGEDSIIDIVHPVTGLSMIEKESLEQIRLRYPSAVLCEFTEHMNAKANRQDSEPREWAEVTTERYYDMLNVLPPAAMGHGAFLVGEPYDHHAKTGRPRFACFKMEGEKCYELSCHITHAEFCKMFGKTAYTYAE